MYYAVKKKNEKGTIQTHFAYRVRDTESVYIDSKGKERSGYIYCNVVDDSILTTIYPFTNYTESDTVGIEELGDDYEEAYNRCLLLALPIEHSNNAEEGDLKIYIETSEKTNVKTKISIN